MTKLKVAYFHYGTYRGQDAEGYTRAINLCTGLSVNHDVTIFTSQRGFSMRRSEVIVGNVRVKILPNFVGNKAKGGWDLLSGFIRAIQGINGGYDLMIFDCVQRPTNISAFFLSKVLASKKITICDWWEYYGNNLESASLLAKMKARLEGYLEILTRKQSSVVVSLSSSLKNHGVSNGIPADRIKVIHPGIDSSIGHEQSDKTKSELDGLIIGFNDDEFHNCREVMEFMLSKYPEIRFTTTGTVVDLPAEYEGRVSQNEWLSYAEFKALIAKSDFSLLCQLDSVKNRTRFPNKFGDYIAIQKPVITNFVGDIEDYRHMESIIDSSSEDAIDDLVRNIDKYKAKARLEMSELTITKSWTQVANEYLNAYYEAVR